MGWAKHLRTPTYPDKLASEIMVHRCWMISQVSLQGLGMENGPTGPCAGGMGAWNGRMGVVSEALAVGGSRNLIFFIQKLSFHPKVIFL